MRMLNLTAALVAACLVFHHVAASGAGSTGGAGLASQLVATGLNSPVFVTHAPADPSRVFVLERRGRVRVIRDGQLLPTPFLNIWSLVSDAGEGGMLGLAFHPNYQSNGWFYVRYNDTLGRTTVARYKASSNPDLATASSATMVMQFSQPTVLHTGGSIEFGPDGYLYVSQGDGTTPDSAQDVTGNWYGKVLRIDVNGDAFPADPLRNYAIPPTNPFVGAAGDDEIWAYGLRNPYRFSFDPATGDLWIADVGATSWEEVNVQPGSSTAARNYGWPCMEALQCGTGPGCQCGSPSYTPPVWGYSHSSGCAIVGGQVYRGCAIPDFHGAYFCADFCSGKIWSFHLQGGMVTGLQQHQAALDPPGPAAINAVAAIGADARGELYICDLDGEVYKIVPLNPLDVNGNGRPDGCEAIAAADLDGDGAVASGDLALLLGVWGACAGCAADFNVDGAVNGQDLAILLGAWS